MIEVPVLPVISNLAFLIPCIYTLSVGLIHESFTFLLITIISSLYHYCYGITCGVMNRELLQFLDFYYSYMSFTDVIIYFMDIYPRRYKFAAQHIASITLMLVSYLDRFNITYPAVLFSIALFLGIIHQIRKTIAYFVDMKKPESKWLKWYMICGNPKLEFKPCDIISVIIGGILFTVAFICQCYSSHEYDILHSIWHICLAFSSLFMFTLYRKDSVCGMCYRKVRDFKISVENIV